VTLDRSVLVRRCVDRGCFPRLRADPFHPGRRSKLSPRSPGSQCRGDDSSRRRSSSLTMLRFCPTWPARTFQVRVERRLGVRRCCELTSRSPELPGRSWVEEVLAFAGARSGDRALEVCAGTGNATSCSPLRGLDLVCARAEAPRWRRWGRLNCAVFERLTITQRSSERWIPGGERFPAGLLRQSWHLVSPDVVLPYARAKRRGGCSVPGGHASDLSGPPRLASNRSR